MGDQERELSRRTVGNASRRMLTALAQAVFAQASSAHLGLELRFQVFDKFSSSITSGFVGRCEARKSLRLRLSKE
jgi:hypothetical protein